MYTFNCKLSLYLLSLSLLEASGGYLFPYFKKGFEPSNNKLKNGALAAIL